MRKVILVCVAALAACSKQSAPSVEVDAAPAPIAEAPVDAGIDAGSAYAQIRRIPTMAEAIAFAVTQRGDADAGAHIGALFSLWASEKMRWVDVNVSQDETTAPLARKDPSAAIGKRVCPQIRIDRIRAVGVKSVDKMFAVVMHGMKDTFTGYAVRSTGALVDHDLARFCGVVTGVQDDGAIALVGMFDLPENK
jgi:hypothetical protein